jgi:hypothetical protein
MGYLLKVEKQVFDKVLAASRLAGTAGRGGGRKRMEKGFSDCNQDQLLRVLRGTYKKASKHDLNMACIKAVYTFLDKINQ